MPVSNWVEVLIWDKPMTRDKRRSEPMRGGADGGSLTEVLNDASLVFGQVPDCGTLTLIEEA